MTIEIESLTALPKLAAGYIGDHGWAQGTEENAQGQVCLTGALRRCSPVPGDFYIARQVFRRRGRTEDWNDADGRTAVEVTDYLATAEITDAELADVFGPQWREIIAQVPGRRMGRRRGRRMGRRRGTLHPRPHRHRRIHAGALWPAHRPVGIRFRPATSWRRVARTDGG